MYNTILEVIESERLTVVWDGLILSAEETAQRLANRIDEKIS